MKPSPQRLALEALEERTLLATCTVTNLLDFGRGGLSFVSGQSAGDLRFCINQANAIPGPDVIDFTVTGTINLNRALPDLASDIDIQGPGADLLTVRRTSSERFRILHAANTAATVQVSGITMSGGYIFGLDASGGGILNRGRMIILGCVISDNIVRSTQFAYGGGIYNAGDLTVIDSTISGNEADTFARGGGIANIGTLSVYHSTIRHNGAGFSPDGGGRGGGLWSKNGIMTVLNSTIDSNEAPELVGAGAYVDGGFAVISHSTITHNESLEFGAVFITSGGLVFMRNTILASNGPRDLSGTLKGSGHNLIGDTTGGNGFAPTDILNVDPLLGPLADNGGPTLTRALSPSSPAVDAGDNADAPEFDQRGPGFPRIVNGTIDIGAFEVQSIPAPTPARFLAFLISADLNDDQSEAKR